MPLCVAARAFKVAIPKISSFSMGRSYVMTMMTMMTVGGGGGAGARGGAGAGAGIGVADADVVMTTTGMTRANCVVGFVVSFPL